MARVEVEVLNKSLGLTNATRFINLLEVAGIDRKSIERESGHVQRANGFELELQIPIFDLGEVRVRQASETYAQAVNRLMEKAVTVRSEARDAYRAYRSAYDIAAHYQREVIPLRRTITEQTLLRYNAMQIDVFSLLAETRQRINSQSQSIEAQRDFWLGATNLTTAVVGGGSSGEAGGEARTAAASGGEAGGH
jgi:outer membrane protein TolC